MSLVKTVACDECGSVTDVTTYRISRNPGEPTKTVDLCKKHSKTMDSLFERGEVRRRTFNARKAEGTV